MRNTRRRHQRLQAETPNTNYFSDRDEGSLLGANETNALSLFSFYFVVLIIIYISAFLSSLPGTIHFFSSKRNLLALFPSFVALCYISAFQWFNILYYVLWFSSLPCFVFSLSQMFYYFLFVPLVSYCSWIHLFSTPLFSPFLVISSFIYSLFFFISFSICLTIFLPFSFFTFFLFSCLLVFLLSRISQQTVFNTVFCVATFMSFTSLS